MNFHGELVDVTFSLSLLVNRLYNDKTIYSLLSVTKKRKCIMWHCDKHMGSGAAMQTADCRLQTFNNQLPFYGNTLISNIDVPNFKCYLTQFVRVGLRR